LDRLTVAISGASAGFGQVIARSFARAGARLVIIGRRVDRLRAFAEELHDNDVHILCCDIRDTKAYPAALTSLPSPFSDVDVLINNAGLGLGRDLAQNADLADWLAMVETNVTGLIAGTQALLPGMVRRNRGHIVNIGSIASQHPTPRNAIYAASKAFVRQFGLCLRADLLGTMIRVTTIEPGQGGGTEFSLVRERGDSDRAAQLYPGSRLITARDVADTVEWVVGRPAHVNINAVELMSVDQAFGPLAFAGN
jgi:3-hydroxy acid dehydrogenase/malonic semialdehyde reductase